MGRQARVATLVLALAAPLGCQDDRSEIVLEVDGAELTAVSWGSGQTVCQRRLKKLQTWRVKMLRSSPELCVKVRGSSSMLRLGCLGDLLGLEE